jgi:toxin ParE1/3/4
VARVILSPLAEEDLKDIWSFVAEDNPGAADRLIDRIYHTFDLLGANPRAGRSREELRRGLRSLPCGNYVVFHNLTKQGIDVARILHGARDLPELF